MEKKKRGAGLILTSLFAALICAGCFIQIPLPGGIPIVIQDMMAFLSGLLLGPILGSAAVLIFIIIGCLGLPVFTGKAGISVILAGPTGGFIIGYLIAAFLGGLVLSLALPLGKKHGNAKQFVWISVAAFLATVAAFACWLFTCNAQNRLAEYSSCCASLYSGQHNKACGMRFSYKEIPSCNSFLP